MTKAYEDVLSFPTLAKAELQVEEAAAPKPPAVSNAKVDGIDVKATTAVAYAAIYVGRISKKVTNVQLQEVFDTNASVGRYYSKGIAKVLVPLDQLDQALPLNLRKLLYLLYPAKSVLGEARVP